MTSLILLLVAIVIVCVLAFILIDLLASSVGGDARLWTLLKALVILFALLVVLQRAGLL